MYHNILFDKIPPNENQINLNAKVETRKINKSQITYISYQIE